MLESRRLASTSLVFALAFSSTAFGQTTAETEAPTEATPTDVVPAVVEETESKTTGASRPPNILLVLLDDAGFMDFGAYGSDTATPNIDRLGETGTMFTRYYTLPLCGPSRASLLTGQDNHTVGAGTLNEALTDEMRSMPAYSMMWSDDQKTIATRLKSAGYQTFVAGKWGVGKKGKNLPNKFGFDRSWVLDATGSSNYETRSYIPIYANSDVKWYEDGEHVLLPDDFYSSRNIADKMITYIDEADRDKPFFGFLSFQALHLPVQAPREFIDKYDGVFDRGWDVLREERLERAIKLGLVPESTKLADGPHNRRDWDNLSDEEKRYWSRVMQVSAGMMEAADHHFGRVLDKLEANGQLENTIVIVTSDNGPEYNTFGKTSTPPTLYLEQVWMAIEGWNLDYDNLGQPGSLVGIGHEWATVSAAPFHLFKFSAAEGGLRVPFIINGPGVKNLGFVNSRCQVTDITPTLLDAAGVKYSPDEFHGRSMMPVVKGDASEVYGEEDAFAMETSGAAALYRGQWKIVKNPAPNGDGKWHLFDMSKDPGETKDVSADHPKLFQEMQAEFKAYSKEVGIYELPPGENARDHIVVNSAKKFAKNYWWLVTGVVLALLALILGVVWGIRRFIKR